MNIPIKRRKWLCNAISIISIGILFGGVIQTEAKKIKPVPNAINLIPTVTGVSVQDGQLIASGIATATINGITESVPFSAPLAINLAAAQAVGCPVLDLTLGPINLNLLGLVVETSPICLDITAIPGGGLLGDLLCNLGTLLQNGVTVEQILAGGVEGISPKELNTRLTRLLNGVLGNLLDSLLRGLILDGATPCDILHLELGPLNLTLLGLNIVLDDCADGPVVVDITGQSGLLGDLLCGLLGGGGITVGDTLADILNQLLGALGQ